MVIPIHFRDKKPEIKWEVYKNQMPAMDELSLWFAGALHNIAMVTGVNGIAVVDFDRMQSYIYWKLWCQKKGGIARQVAGISYRVQTNRGMHVYIRLPFPEQNRKLDGIDIKAQGGYVLIPPSVHPSGKVYEAINPGAPIMRVSALSDILPMGLLSAHTELPDFVRIPMTKNLVAVETDPWKVLDKDDRVGVDMVTKIREHYRIEDFFPDAVETGGSRWRMTRCPFHDDFAPSFWLDVQRQICGCFSGCTTKPLDVINLYGRLYGLSNHDAIKVMIGGV